MPSNEIIDLKLLQYFIVVADKLSYTDASVTLKITKSKLSKDIAKLEGYLGEKVFDRSSRAIRLTETGKLLYGRALILLEDSNHLINDVKTLSSSVSGRLNVSASPALGRLLSDGLIPGFLKLWPEVNISFKLSYEYENLFKQGLDLAFRMGKNHDENLIERQVGSTNRVLVASPEYLKNNTIRKPRDLLSCKSAQFYDQPQHVWTIQNGQNIEQMSVPTVFQCADFVSVRNAVSQGLGVAQLPWFVVRDKIRQGELLHVLPEWVSPSLPINIVYRQGYNKPNKLAEFLSYIESKKSIFDLEFKQ